MTRPGSWHCVQLTALRHGLGLMTPGSKGSKRAPPGGDISFGDSAAYMDSTHTLQDVTQEGPLARPQVTSILHRFRHG